MAEVGRTGLAALPALGLTVLVHRDLRRADIPGIVTGTASTIGAVMLLIGVAAAFGWILTIERVPQTLAASCC